MLALTPAFHYRMGRRLLRLLSAMCLLSGMGAWCPVQACDELPVSAPAPIHSPWALVSDQAWAIALVILVIFLSSLYWNWRLQIQVRQRKSAQAELQDKLAFQFSLINSLPTPLYVCDLQGRLNTCNRAYEELFCTALENIRGQLPTEQDCLPSIFSQNLQHAHRRLLRAHQPHFVDTSLELNGVLRQLYQWLVPFYNARGELEGLLGGWLDISERKQLELKLRESKQIAQKASAAKSEFLATMSHELRTPLNALVGLLELEASAEPTPSMNLRVAQQSAMSMIDLIGNILDLDKIESGLMQLTPAPTALQPLLSSSLRLFAAQAHEKHLELSLDYCAAPQRMHHLDALRLQQIVHNLISNALKFTHSGAIRIWVQESDTGPDTSLLKLTVSDSGIGIPQEQQAEIFEPYRQAHASIAHLYGGSGLGLSICHQLVQLMGGRIWLDSQPGQGCAVSLELPLTWQAVSPPSAKRRAPTAQASRALHVLVVDDVSTNGLVMALQLERLGHQAAHVCSGAEALLALQLESYDVLISDCNMPDMDGYELTRTVRPAEKNRQAWPLSIIGYTASALTKEATRCLEAGMNQLMIKPVTLERLQEVLSTHHFAPAPTPCEEPICSLNLQHLETFADTPELRRRVLLELRNNLGEEIAQLCRLPATTQAVDDLVHRLNGVACLIDAEDLARACHALKQLAEGDPSGIANGLLALRQSLATLHDDVQQALETVA